MEKNKIMLCQVCAKPCGLVSPDVYNLCVVIHGNCYKELLQRYTSLNAD